MHLLYIVTTSPLAINSVLTRAIQAWFDMAWHTKVAVWMHAMLCQTILCWPWKENRVVQHDMAQRGMAREDHVWMLIELWPAYTHIAYCLPGKGPCTSGLRWIEHTNSCQKHCHLLQFLPDKSPPP